MALRAIQSFAALCTVALAATSVTPTLTPTPSTLTPCSVAGTNQALKNGGGNSLIVLRLGNGTVLATTGLREAFLDEIDLSTGSRLQSWALPSSSSAVALGQGCTIAISQPSSGSTNGNLAQISLSADSGGVFVPCA